MSWAPTASLPTLRLRAELLAAARQFFAQRGVLEVDTPALVRHAVTDLHIHSAQVQLSGHAAPLFLHSSPEYAM
jgi:lysyl-tRNA synthetase class 2